MPRFFPSSSGGGGGGGGATQVEDVSGTIDGSNLIFTTAHNPKWQTLNGITQIAGIDFVISGSGPFTETYIQAPPLTDPSSVLKSFY